MAVRGMLLKEYTSTTDVINCLSNTNSVINDKTKILCIAEDWSFEKWIE